ncbi:hypothetical protein [Clostridium hydrogeniformans]|nr:hypothetical protein [Clostridium hydrogeniformans]
MKKKLISLFLYVGRSINFVVSRFIDGFKVGFKKAMQKNSKTN